MVLANMVDVLVLDLEDDLDQRVGLRGKADRSKLIRCYIRALRSVLFELGGC